MSGELDRLRDAIQDYHRATSDDDGVIVTDYALAYAGVSLATADTDSYIGTVSSGAGHATLGLAHVLVRDLTSELDEDGDA